MVRAASAERQCNDCPHVERNDLRCCTRFRLGRINQAFSVCFGAYRGCPMFHRINGELREPRDDHAPVVITVSGHGVELRPTGT
jgi:hypothetical protein